MDPSDPIGQVRADGGSTPPTPQQTTPKQTTPRTGAPSIQPTDPRSGLVSHESAPYGQNPDPAPSQGHGHAGAASQVQTRREVFWQNVTREVLMAMASAAAAHSGRLSPSPSAAVNSPSPVADMFDGRMAIVTSLGQRIPIADVVPVFAVSRPGCAEERARSADVQCTVFRITTPTGESYTLPIHHIVGIHSMSDALADRLEQAARELEDAESPGLPFGFAAYTSLARSEDAADPPATASPPGGYASGGPFLPNSTRSNPAE